jgi:hypothetical protein
MKRSCALMYCAVLLVLFALQTSANAQPAGPCEGVLLGHYHAADVRNSVIPSVDVWYVNSYVAGQRLTKWYAATLGTQTEATLTGGPSCQLTFVHTRPPDPIWYRLTVSATPRPGVVFLHAARGQCIWSPAYTHCSRFPTLPPLAEYLTW